MSVYTRTGDDGTTGLLGSERVRKDDARIEALGAIDEATAAAGYARAIAKDPRTQVMLVDVQRDLYHLMSAIAAVPDNTLRFPVRQDRVDWLESQIEGLSAVMQMPNEFIVPGDCPAGAAVAVTRAIVRRAERRTVELTRAFPSLDSAIQRYLNRLSSLLFVLEIAENNAAGRSTSKAKTAR